jgi:hypothetical protein
MTATIIDDGHDGVFCIFAQDAKGRLAHILRPQGQAWKVGA